VVASGAERVAAHGPVASARVDTMHCRMARWRRVFAGIGELPGVQFFFVRRLLGFAGEGYAVCVGGLAGVVAAWRVMQERVFSSEERELCDSAQALTGF